MSKVGLLAVAFLKEHPMRVALTTLATVAATCIVIWVASAYDALLRSFDTWANVALGHYELSIAPISQADSLTVPQAVIDAMRGDPAVDFAEPFWVLHATVDSEASREQAGAGTPGFGGGPSAMQEHAIVATSAQHAPFEVDGRWINPADVAARDAVLSAGLARRLEVDVGESIEIRIGEQRHKLRVIGLLQSPEIGIGMYAVPSMQTPASGEVFISTHLAESLLGSTPQNSFVGLTMNPDADITKFRFGWAPKLSRFDPPVQFQEAYEIEERLDESAAADNVRIQSYAATGIAMLVAMLVIFCTINMGVTERIREFAVLRAVGLTRRDLCLLIFAESLVLAASGFVLALAISWSLLSLIASAFSRLLQHGAAIGFHSLVFAAVSAFGGALLAAALPAWRATRVRPIDAMAPLNAQQGTMVVPRRSILLGMALIAVNPLLTFVFPPRFEPQIYPTMALGFIATAIGFVLVAPAVVALVDRWIGPRLARMFRIESKLLASQITSHLWRTVAAALSLSIGLGLYIAIQVWGHTMLDAFIVGPWAPDAVLIFGTEGATPQKIAELSQIPSINPEQCVPIVVEQPRLLEDLTGSGERASVTRQDNVVIVGIDPQTAFGGHEPLMELEWVAGDRDSAISRMREGRACIVPDHFLTESGLQVGDVVDLVPPEDSMQRVRYTIAGAVRLPGWHWQTKLTGFRSRTHRAAALVFARYSLVATDFNRPAATHLWFNYSPGTVDAAHIADRANQILNRTEPAHDSTAEPQAGDALVRIMPAEEIRQMTRRNAARWMWGVSVVPLLATIIAGLGVLNVMLASVRSRHWELGVLRSIGITQSSIVRAIVAEGVMIGLSACFISLGFGVVAGWCGCETAQYISFFGGLHPDLNVPWGRLAIGLVVVLALTILAAVWPAVATGRKKPLDLLQSGRLQF